ncbi:hypothetical protein C8F04DRAFT_1175925 [Mycena alexandri]|uniref:Uncharacterized protein n=1 Tax=Mycena alexandri TaxID=1745969 RepID=A0AAD6TF61_9AGAR|nr:hypothetical protein C8F04DRAFT_1175925 [Mycena alexandri]
MSSYNTTWNFPPDMQPGDFSLSPPPPDSQSQSFQPTDFSRFSVFNTPTASQIPFGSPIPSYTAFSARIASDSDDFPANPFEPRPVTTAQFNSANERFERANEHAEVVLSVNRDRANARGDTLPLTGGNKLGKQATTATEQDKENVESRQEEGGEEKAKYTGPRLIILARAAVDAQPFLAAHGEKGSSWQSVVNIMKLDKEFRNTSLTANSVQHKAEALVAFKKNPNAQKSKKLSSIIGQGTSSGIIIGALLERLEEQYDSAKDKSDDAKAKIKKKNDEDREGGNAIREASMKTFRKRRHDPSPASDDDTNLTDTGGASTSTPASRAPAPSSSLETLDEKPKRKRRRRNASSDTDGLLALMQQESERRAKHDEKVEHSLDTFIDNNRKQKDEYLALLREAMLRQ